MKAPLPNNWIERIFAKLQGVYGREFTSMFSTGMVNGIDAGLENAKNTWSEELAEFSIHPEAIAYALNHLPDRVPNCVKFKELCKVAPKIEPKRIERKFTPEEIERNKARLKKILSKLNNRMYSN